MPNSVKVRDATPDDVPTIVDFNCRLARETESKDLDPAIITPGVQQALAQPTLCRYFIAELDSQVVGQTMITYEWSDLRNGVFWWIQSVYVRAEQRAGGLSGPCTNTSPAWPGQTRTSAACACTSTSTITPR